jgi:hypothetical protein
MSDKTHNGLLAALTQLLTLAEKSNTFAEFEAAANQAFAEKSKETPEIEIINATHEHVQLKSVIHINTDARRIVDFSLSIQTDDSFELQGRIVPRATFEFQPLPVIQGRYYIVPELYVHLAKRNGRTSDDLLCYVDDVLCQIF